MKPMLIRPTGLALLLFFAVIASCSEQDTVYRNTIAMRDEAKPAVLAEIESYYNDMSARDWEAYAGHFWEGATMATIWPAPGEDTLRVWIFTIPEFIAQTPEGPDSKPIFEEHLTGAEVTVSGDLAQVWAHYEARFGDEEEVMEWSGIDAFTLMRFDDRWRITSLAYASE